MDRRPPLIASVLLALLLHGLVQADEPALSKQEAEARLAQLQTEIGELQQELSRSRTHFRGEQKRLKAMDLNIQSTALEMRRMEREIAGKESELQRLRNERTDYLAALGQRRAVLREQIVAAYGIGQQSRLKLLLNQDDPGKLGRMLAYYDYLSKAQARRIGELRTALQTLDRLQAGIDEVLAGLRTARRRQAATLEQLEEERGQRHELLEGLRQQIESGQSRLEELTRNRADLEALLQRLTEALADIPTDLGQYQHPRTRRGELPMPLQGPVLHAFGQERAGGMHWQGWLIQAESGTEVSAVAYGRVAYADWLRGYGLLMIIDHGDGFMSLYGNNESLLFEPGDWIQPGESIGTVGSAAGDEQGLYFELRNNGEAIDPAVWIRRGRPGP